MATIEQDKALDLIKAGKNVWNTEILKLLALHEEISIVVNINDYDFENLNFEGFNLSCNITFNSCTFKSDNLFKDIKKAGYITFKNCPEIGKINFNNAIIKSISIYSDSITTKIQSFSVHGEESKIHRVYIVNAIILGKLSIRNLQEENNQEYETLIEIGDCIVHDNVCFSNSRFKGRFMLYNCEFKVRFLAKDSYFSAARFTNCKFNDLTDFRRTIFGRPPYFDGATLHPHTLFPPKENFKFAKRTGVDDSVDEDTEAFRTLRHHAVQLLNRPLQGMFYHLEQEHRQTFDRITKPMEYSFSKIYKIFSDYGTSLSRPLYGIAALIIVFIGFNALLMSPKLQPCLKIDMSIISEASLITLQNTFAPFRNLFQDEIVSHWGITILGIINSLCAIGLFALFLLALRWTFKKD